jgi:DNA-binding transcriptional regulator LsrR (DeoR family)
MEYRIVPFTESTPVPPSDFDEEITATVSRMFWLEDRSKIEIADELHFSRFKVARILDDARRYGIVHIEISEPRQRLEHLEHQLRDVFGLVDVRLSVRPMAASGGLAELGVVAAAYLDSILTPNSVLGLGWGATLAEVVDHLASGGPADVVQLAGGFASSAATFNGNQLVLTASAILGGTPYLLHAPAMVSTSTARALLRDDETIARTVARYRDLTAVITGVGSLNSVPSSALYRSDVLSKDVHDELRARHIVGDTCCHFIDEDGHVDRAFEERVTGISVEDIHATPTRIAVAGGPDKLHVIHSALKSKLPNVLVTDVGTARALLAMAPSAMQDAK